MLDDGEATAVMLCCFSAGMSPVLSAVFSFFLSGRVCKLPRAWTSSKGSCLGSNSSGFAYQGSVVDAASTSNTFATCALLLVGVLS
jgi:hypothetical protein